MGRAEGRALSPAAEKHSRDLIVPVTVIVRSNAETSPSLTFDGQRIVIGRSDGSDVRLPDPSVSLRHASIRADGANYTLIDEGSTNGTWVGGVKLPPHTPRLVKTGDLVRVGRVWLELAIGQRAATPDLALATRDLALAMVKQAMEAHGDDTRIKVHVAEGPDLGREIVLREENRPYVVGRAETCDLPLADEDASRQHATITRRGNQVFVLDKGSSNGVFFGETRLPSEREMLWRVPAMLRVGLSVLALDEPLSQLLIELGNLPDEKLPKEAEAEPAPPSSLVAPSAPPAPAPEPAPPSAKPAPIVAAPDSRAEPTVRSPKKKGWGLVDIAVIGVAVAIIGASIAGLIWVLR